MRVEGGGNGRLKRRRFARLVYYISRENKLGRKQVILAET